MSEIVDYAALAALRQAANRTWNQDELWRDYEAAQNAYSTALFDAAPALIAKAKEADDEWRAQFERANIYKTLANNLSGELDAARSLLAKAGETLDGYLCDCPTVCVPPCSDAAARSIRDEIKDAL